mgnify:CR=1 FL=1
MSADELYLGTEPMRNGLELETKAVENYFNHLFPFLEENLSITQFRGGQSNPTYRVISGKHAWVIRRKPPGPLLPSAASEVASLIRSRNCAMVSLGESN